MLLRKLKAGNSTFPFMTDLIVGNVVAEFLTVTCFFSVSDAKPWEI